MTDPPHPFSATAFKCPTKLRAQTEAWKKKMEKPQVGEKVPITDNSPDDRPVSRQIDMDVDTNAIDWAKSPGVQSSGLSPIDDNLSEDAQDK